MAWSPVATATYADMACCDPAMVGRATALKTSGSDTDLTVPMVSRRGSPIGALVARGCTASRHADAQINQI